MTSNTTTTAKSLPLEATGTTSAVYATFAATGRLDEAELARFIERKRHHPALHEGTVVNGRYRILHALGSGGMGDVYGAVDLGNKEQRIALKILWGDELSSDVLDLFKAEFKTMATLRHPNIASVYDFEPIKNSANHCFTLEWVQGKTLLQTVNADTQSILDAIVPLCRALAYIHSRNVLHLDLKPENVIVGEDGQIKLVDFGLSGARAGGAYGTPVYVAPERLRGEALDARADLYSLGVVIFQLLCRRVPFDTTRGLDNLLRQHLSTPVAFTPEEQSRIPQWLRDIVLRLCAKHPAERYQSANSVIDAVNAGGGLHYDSETQNTRESYVFSSNFVGREAELERAGKFVNGRLEGSHDAKDERCGLFVGGVSGLGKSRFMRELRYSTQLGMHCFYEGNAYEGLFNEYDPIIQVLGFLIPKAQSTTSGQQVLDRLGEEIAKLVPNLPYTPSKALDHPSAEKARLLNAVAQFFMDCAHLSPFAVYFNDLQWARSGTCDFLVLLLEHIRDSERAGKDVPIVVLGSFRDNEVERRPVALLLMRARSQKILEEIKLEPLAISATERLVESMLGKQVVPTAMVKQFHDQTHGSPFFIEEVVRYLVHCRAVTMQQGAWRLSDERTAQTAAESIAQTFLRRAELLSDDERTLLNVLAACAQPVSPRILGAASGVNIERVSQSLVNLERAQMARRIYGDLVLYQVQHDQLREAVYKSLDESNKKTVHGSLGQAFEHLYGAELNPWIYDLAFHYQRTDSSQKALHYCRLAADKAESECANDVALEMYEQVLKLSPDSTAGQALLEKIADVAVRAARHEQARALYSEMHGSARSRDDQARFLRKKGETFLIQGNLPEARRDIVAALKLLGSHVPENKLLLLFVSLGSFARHQVQQLFRPSIRPVSDARKMQRLLEIARAYYTFAWIHFFLDPNWFPLAVLRGLNAAERVPKTRELARLTAMMGMVYDTLPMYNRGIQMHERADGLAQAYGDLADYAFTRLMYGLHLFYRSRWNECIAVCSDAKHELKRVGDAFMASACNVHIFYSLDYLGRLQEARSIADEMNLELVRSKIITARTSYYLLARVCGRLGAFDEALQHAERAIKMSKSGGDALMLCKSTMERGEIYFWMGRFEDAAASLEEAKRIREKMPLVQEYVVRLYPLLARTYLELAAQAQAPESRMRYLQRATQTAKSAVALTKVRTNYLTLALAAQGRALAMSGNDDAAKQAFDRAVGEGTRLGATLQLADVHYERGTTESLRPLDRAAAVKHFEAAEKLYNLAGAKPSLVRAQDKLASLRSEEPRS